MFRYHMSLILKSFFFDQTGCQCPANGRMVLSLNDSMCYKKLLSKKKSHKTFLEMSMGSLLANRKWPCYLENWDSSDVNNHLVHFWSHQKLSSETRSKDAQNFLYLVYSGLRHHFALDAIVSLVNWYWQLDFKWTKTKVFVFIMLSKWNYG